MIKRLWYSLLSNDKPQDKNVIWIDTSNSESFTLKLYRNGGWKPLQVVGTSRDMIERELTGYVTSHYHSYDRIINKPTTLEGYGITDCFNKKEVEKLLDNKVTKVDGMSLTSNNFSDKYKKMLDDLSTSYYNKKNVDNLLNEKQDVISDLESIREGAKKGNTALQSFTETDPIYLKDKPFIALKSDLLNDNNFVHKEGDEDIRGSKWFEHIRTNNFGICQDDNNNHSIYIDYHYDESNYLPILHFGSEEDWLTILDNIADPVDDFHAANKHYVDTKILTTEENLVHKDGFERITERKQFQKGIGVGLFNTLVANEDSVESGAWLDQAENPAPFIVADPTADDHAATKLYVDKGLATKQNTLTNTDGGYGQRVAELETGKQNTLTAGNGISIEGNVIGVTAITESESQPDTSLWLNPSEDEETNVTYNRSQIDAMVGAKQDALQLTVKDNGNIVLSNIQGQSKEFMPATPSGDPMHYAYEAVGAVWNGTGADIVKNAPWAELADDDADKTVVHKAGYWYLNGLGDLTNADMRLVYFTPIFNGGFPAGIYYNTLARTVICSLINASAFVKASWNTLCRNGKIEILGNNLQSTINVYDSMVYSFAFSQMKAILYTINLSTTKISSEYSPFANLNKLRYIKLKKLNNSLSITYSSFLTCKSILYMIQNEAATSAITITLHADAYTRAMANADIVAALEAHPNVSLASA